MTPTPTPVPLGRPLDPERATLVRSLRDAAPDEWIVVAEPKPNPRALATALRNNYLVEGEKLRTRSWTDGSVSLRIEK